MCVYFWDTLYYVLYGTCILLVNAVCESPVLCVTIRHLSSLWYIHCSVGFHHMDNGVIVINQLYLSILPLIGFGLLPVIGYFKYSGLEGYGTCP